MSDEDPSPVLNYASPAQRPTRAQTVLGCLVVALIAAAILFVLLFVLINRP